MGVADLTVEPRYPATLNLFVKCRHAYFSLYVYDENNLFLDASNLSFDLPMFQLRSYEKFRQGRYDDLGQSTASKMTTSIVRDEGRRTCVTDRQIAKNVVTNNENETTIENGEEDVVATTKNETFLSIFF